jgi:putative tryptophan/tyrosine transport system substrate-binding protein
MIERREFVTLLGSAAAWPLAATAQQQSMPVIGYLSTRSLEDTTHLLAAFRTGLAQSGYVEGQNVTIEYRWALGQYDRLPGMAAELVRRPVTILATTGGEPAAFAATAATSTIPIVYLIGGDPVKEGLAASFNRPGGNATGVTLLTNILEPKRFGVLRDLMPGASLIGVLLNPKFPAAEPALRDVEAAAKTLDVRIQPFRASNDDEIDAAFEAIARARLGALAITADPFFDTRRQKLVALAANYAIPTIYQFREYAQAGGLISYGIDNADAYRQTGVYTGLVLKGAKPADLPIMQETKFLCVINMKTARALGIKISDNLLSLADEVIE